MNLMTVIFLKSNVNDFPIQFQIMLLKSLCKPQIIDNCVDFPPQTTPSPPLCPSDLSFVGFTFDLTI